MSDFETMKAMLDRAKIPFGKPRQIGPRYHGDVLAAGAQSIAIGGVEEPPQPFDGGYSGFYTEIVFDKDGQLLGVWAWE